MPTQYRPMHSIRKLAHKVARPQGKCSDNTQRPYRDRQRRIQTYHTPVYELHVRNRRHRDARHDTYTPRNGLRIHTGRPLDSITTKQGNIPHRLIQRETRLRDSQGIHITQKLFLECRHLRMERFNHSQRIPSVQPYYK